MNTRSDNPPTLIERLETNEGCLCSCTPDYTERGLVDPSCRFCDSKVLNNEAAEALCTLQAENAGYLADLNTNINRIAELQTENEALTTKLEQAEQYIKTVEELYSKNRHDAESCCCRFEEDGETPAIECSIHAAQTQRITGYKDLLIEAEGLLCDPCGGPAANAMAEKISRLSHRPTHE